jgi:hypothetical protein
MIIWLGHVNITTASGTTPLREILLRINIPVDGVRHRVNQSNTTGYIGQWTLVPLVVAPANVPHTLRIRLNSTWTNTTSQHRRPRRMAGLWFQQRSRISDSSEDSWSEVCPSAPQALWIIRLVNTDSGVFFVCQWSSSWYRSDNNVVAVGHRHNARVPFPQIVEVSFHLRLTFHRCIESWGMWNKRFRKWQELLKGWRT